MTDYKIHVKQDPIDSSFVAWTEGGYISCLSYGPTEEDALNSVQEAIKKALLADDGNDIIVTRKQMSLDALARPEVQHRLKKGDA